MIAEPLMIVEVNNTRVFLQEKRILFWCSNSFITKFAGMLILKIKKIKCIYCLFTHTEGSLISMYQISHL